MADIVGVRFKRAGKVYYFDPAGAELKVNDYLSKLADQKKEDVQALVNDLLCANIELIQRVR